MNVSTVKKKYLKIFRDKWLELAKFIQWMQSQGAGMHIKLKKIRTRTVFSSLIKTKFCIGLPNNTFISVDKNYDCARVRWKKTHNINFSHIFTI